MPQPLRTAAAHLALARQPCVSNDGGLATPLAARDAAMLAWLALEGPTPRAPGRAAVARQ